MIKTILKASLVCWVVVLSFGVFFALVPDSADRLTGPILSLVLGVAFAVYVAARIYRIRKEGFDIGWFLAEQHGPWLVFLAITAIVLLLLGVVWLVAPQRFDLILDKHAMPVAAALVILFWVSLIFIFLAWALVCFSQSVGYARLKDLRSMAMSFLVGVLWMAFAALFGSLFLEVINDEFVRISAPTQHYILSAFALTATAVGLASGMFIDPKPLDEEGGKSDIET